VCIRSLFTNLHQKTHPFNRSAVCFLSTHRQVGASYLKTTSIRGFSFLMFKQDLHSSSILTKIMRGSVALCFAKARQNSQRPSPKASRTANARRRFGCRSDPQFRVLLCYSLPLSPPQDASISAAMSSNTHNWSTNKICTPRHAAPPIVFFLMRIHQDRRSSIHARRHTQVLLLYSHTESNPRGFTGCFLWNADLGCHRTAAHISSGGKS